MPDHPLTAPPAPPPPAPRAWRRWLRAAAPMAPLLLVLTVLTLGGLPRDDRRALERELREGTFQLSPGQALRAVRAYLSNPDDMYHFFAYAQATLGRPYRSYFIRSRAQWEAAFVRGVQQDPDTTPVIVPPAPLRPYRDFLVEYPPGFFLVLLPPALLASTADDFALAFKLQSALYLLLALLLAQRLAREVGVVAAARAGLPRAFALAVLALGVVCTHRFDAFVAVCIVGSALAAARGRAATAGLALGIGIAAKGVPLLLAPLFGAYLLAERGAAAATRALGGLLIAAGGLGLLGWAWGGPGVLDAFAYHRDRPVHIESTSGALLSLASSLGERVVTVVYSYSSRNLRGPPVQVAGALTSVLVLLALALALLFLLHRLRTVQDRRQRLTLLIDGAGLLLAAYVTLGRVFCPQYLVWVLPLALVAAVAGGRSPHRPTVGLALLAATQVIYPISYTALKALAPWASALVLLRNLGVLLWAVTLLRSRAPVPIVQAVSDLSPSATQAIAVTSTRPL